MLNLIYSILYNNINKKLCIIIIFGSVVLSSDFAKGYSSKISNQNEGNDTLLTVQEQADSLKKYGDLILCSKGNERIKYQKLFFEYFPDSFDRFDSLYGYKEVTIDSTVFMPLCSSDHIEEILPTLDAINNTDNRTDYYKKLICIAIGGSWAGDHVGTFQYLLRKKVKKDLETTIKILETLNDKQIKSFWLFFFDYENQFIADDDFCFVGKKLREMKDIIYNIYHLMKQAKTQDEIKKKLMEEGDIISNIYYLMKQAKTQDEIKWSEH